ncbi:MAG: DUF3131 domain-containing protein [Gammaproteobacteria bacterium]|nr:DUF3131 domain-containing protein [Gammaproteobacteria bacterium]
MAVALRGWGWCLSLCFLTCLVAGTAFADLDYQVEDYLAPVATTKIGLLRAPQEPYFGRHGPLSEEEMNMARTAWKYMENNFQPTTGLVNAVNAYPSTTMWDTASYLGGMVAARELGIIDKSTFDQRMIPLLKTFNELDLFKGELPNKAYNTENGSKVNYANQPGEIGYSALDLGRLLIWFHIIKNRYPEHGNAIDSSIMRWNFCNVVDETGTMYGAVVTPEQTVQLVQEGRLGYEEYAAKGFNLWGFDTARASLAKPYSLIPIFDVDVPYDTRDPRRLKAHNYVVSESYVLDGLEFNWDLPHDGVSGQLEHTDPVQSDFAQRIYAVQVRRFEETGILTARTEHQLAGEPYFVYDTIYTDGYAWNTITETGKYVPQFAAIALKGALGMWALWNSAYTDLLFNAISGLFDPDKGFYEGRFENGLGVIDTFTANNNGIMLESLLYKAQGKLYRQSGQLGLWENSIRDEFSGKERCMPQHRKQCKCCNGGCSTPKFQPPAQVNRMPETKHRFLGSRCGLDYTSENPNSTTLAEHERYLGANCRYDDVASDR